MSLFYPSLKFGKEANFKFFSVGSGLGFGTDKVTVDGKEYEYPQLKLSIRAPDLIGKYQLSVVIGMYLLFAVLILVYNHSNLPMIGILILAYPLSLLLVVDSIYRRHLRKFIIVSVENKALKILPFNSTYSVIVQLVSQKGGEVKIFSLENQTKR
jgi:hypothetical protein